MSSSSSLCIPLRISTAAPVLLTAGCCTVLYPQCIVQGCYATIMQLCPCIQVLIEAGQRLPDGRLRQRGLPLSEKMIGQECWQAAAVRAVSEELATALPQDWKTQVWDMGSQLFTVLLIPSSSNMRSHSGSSAVSSNKQCSSYACSRCSKGRPSVCMRDHPLTIVDCMCCCCCLPAVTNRRR